MYPVPAGFDGTVPFTGGTVPVPAAIVAVTARTIPGYGRNGPVPVGDRIRPGYPIPA